MSQNFQKVKRKLQADMANTPFHTQKSWCDIMLKAASRCISDADQKDFYRYILNPDDSWDIQEPTFGSVDPDQEIKIQTTEKYNIKREDDEKTSTETVTTHNQIHTNGRTTYITATPVVCTSLR